VVRRQRVIPKGGWPAPNHDGSETDEVGDPVVTRNSDVRFDDGFAVTAPVGRFKANAWGLFDMHGNAAEWTASLYRPYPYREEDGRGDPQADGSRVVRGGSFFRRPQGCSSSARWAYPAWQRVFDIGFRVLCQTDATPASGLSGPAAEPRRMLDRE